MSRACHFIIGFLFATGIATARAQAPSEAPVTTISELLSLDGREAEENPRPVRLTGIVLGESSMFPFVSLHDGTRGVGVRLKREHPELKPGDLVQINGKTTMINVGGHIHIRAVADLVDIIGAEELPAARAITVPEITSPVNYDQWVSLEGYVMEWKYRSPDLFVRIITNDGYGDANVTIADASGILPTLSGAKVRISGAIVSTPTMGVVMFVPSQKQMEVIEPGVKDVFDTPEASISDVMSRKLDMGKRWRVKGVVAAREQDRMVVIRGEGCGMSCHLSATRSVEQPDTAYGDGGKWPELNPGDVVELVGSMISRGDADLRACGLAWCHARVVGKEAPPKPSAVSFDDIVGWKNHDDWVTVDAVVVGWMMQSNILCYALLGSHSYGQVYVREVGAIPFPTDLHGARLRFTGVSRSLLGAHSDALLVHGLDHVEVIKPGSSDPFAVPEASATEISSGRLPPSDRVKMRGVIVGRPSEAVLCVRGRDCSIRAGLQYRWNRPADPTGIVYADCGLWPDMSVGDEIELLGSPMRNLDGSPFNGDELWSCQLRVLKRGGEVKPVETRVANVVHGDHACDLVELRGRLLSLHQLPMAKGEWRTTMLVEDDGAKLPATLTGAGRANLGTLKIDDEILLRGVVERATSNEPLQIALASVADVRSLGVSPAIRQRQIWIWGGGGAVVVALLLSWIAVLRRAGRVQAEVAQVLEQKVNERTVELQRAKTDLTRALDQERELGELKSRFVTTVSHEFRTPLGIIMSAIELIRHYDERLPADQRRELHQDIFSSTRHMAGLMEQVLVLGRVEAGKLACKTASCDINAFAEKITDECLSATHRKCPVIWKPEGDLSGAIADEALLRHIFSNLIANAVKYSPDGSTVEFTVHRDGGLAVFKVIDHGIGIPVADRPHLFEAFQRGSNVGEIPGTGLGLVIVKRCIDLHGGSAEIESEVGKGTTFIVRLPLFGRDEG